MLRERNREHLRRRNRYCQHYSMLILGEYPWKYFLCRFRRRHGSFLNILRLLLASNALPQVLKKLAIDQISRVSDRLYNMDFETLHVDDVVRVWEERISALTLKSKDPVDDVPSPRSNKSSTASSPVGGMGPRTPREEFNAT